MFEVTRFEIRRRIDPAMSMGLYIGAIALFVVLLFPFVERASDGLALFVGALPVVVRNGLGIEAIDTIEGVLAVQFYQIVVVLLLGMDVAYTAAASVAQQVRDGRIEFTLTSSLPRWRFVGEMFVALLPELIAIGAVSFATIQLGLLVVGETIAPTDFVVVHLLAFVYLAVCAAIGLCFSVVVDDPIAAQWRASATVLVLFAIDAITVESGWSWLGVVSPSRHYDPTAILVHGEYDPTGTALLLVAIVVMLAAGAAAFANRDLTRDPLAE